MEENNKNGHPEGCKCEMCYGRCYACGGYHHWMRGHWLLRLAIAVVVLTVTFWCGVKLGEIKAYIEPGYGGYGMPYGRMMWGGGQGYYYGYGPGMMYGQNNGGNAANRAPQTSTPAK